MIDRAEQFRLIEQAIRNTRSGAITADVAMAQIQHAIDRNPDAVSVDIFRAIVRTMTAITSEQRNGRHA